MPTQTKLFDAELSDWARDNYERKYALRNENGELLEDWPQTAERVVSNVLGALGYSADDYEYKALLDLIIDRKFIPGGRYLYAAGRELHQISNCFLLKADDSREGWADLLKKSAMILQTGGGVGIYYGDIRPYGSPIKKTGGIASGPLPLAQMVNEVGRGVIQGGNRRSAIIAILPWDHADIFKYIHMKDWPEEIKKLKEDDFNFPATMDMTNISISLNDDFFDAYRDENHPKHELATSVYNEAVENMIATGEPGFTIDVNGNSGDVLRNPCGEVVSSDDSDVCNLGSINLSRITDKNELDEIISLSTLFLLAGTEYSTLPYEQVGEIRDKNRRLGLGVMGVHDWLLQRGYPYEPNEELKDWLSIYANKSDEHASSWADKHNLSRPVATRAIAPTGTLGIIGETTTGIEPIYCVAYKRRYLDDNQIWKFQYVVDPTAHRLIQDKKIEPGEIEDAYTLSYNVEKRIWFQAWVQQFVDMGISSTVNLPYAVTAPEEVQYYKDILIDYLPSLRGLTFYPDGARGGQPLSPATYDVAIKEQGVVFEEDIDASCKNGVCGS